VRLSADQRITCQRADGYPQQYLPGRTRARSPTWSTPRSCTWSTRRAVSDSSPA